MIKRGQEYQDMIQKVVYLRTIERLTDLEILVQFNIFKNEFLDPIDFNVLNFMFPEKMEKLTNGCKPSYLPDFIKVDGCKKRTDWCNLHDFCYWISHLRSHSDKIFIVGMNSELKGFNNKFKNYRFYVAVRTFGASAYSEERKTIEDFLNL